MNNTMSHKLNNERNENTVVYECVLKVSRPDSEIDILNITITPNLIVENTLKNLPFVDYKKKTGIFSFKIYFTAKVCHALLMSGVSIDMSELSKWNNLILSWFDNYEMMDISKLDLPFTPYPFQIEDIKNMLKSHTLLNANDMGCGKTFECVVVGESLPMKKLVICPATLRLNWEDEIRNVNPNADIVVLYNNMPYQTGKDWTIIGYSSVDKFSKELENEMFQCIFIDEAHYCQAINGKGEPSSKRAKTILRLAATSNYTFPITGTPKPTRNKDLFNILRIIKHPLASKKESFYNYAYKFCNAQTTQHGLNCNGNSNDEILGNMLKPHMIRHLKREVLPHLKKQRKSIPVMIDLREYKKTIEEYREFLKKKRSSAEELQIVMKAKKTLAFNKAPHTIELAEEILSYGKKVIIVTCFTEVVERMENAFKGNIVKIVGGMTDTQKQKSINDFQKGDIQVLVMNIKAGGVGLTLTSAHHLIFNDYDWTVGNITQAEDRICRGNQKELCFIYFMTARGAKEEEYFIDMLTRKSKSIDMVVDGGSGEAIDFRYLVEKVSSN